MTRARRRRHYTVRTIHASGLYSASLSALTLLVAWLMALPGVSIISGTEADSRPDSFLKRTGWAFAHGAAGSKESRQLWLAWRTRRWQLQGVPRAPAVSSLTYFTHEGRLKESHRVLRVKLRCRRSGRLFIFYVVHMSLDNTGTRAALWVDECRGLANLMDRDAAAYPDAVQVLEGDMNKNWRNAADRAMCHEHLVEPMGLTCVWEDHLPAEGGTHGPSSILDHLYVRGAGVDVLRAVLFEVTALMRKASDHFPFKAVLAYSAPTNPTKEHR
jgi:endonuclease/exonuclease/phosphatase family metal-dependent hydrolase